MDHDAGMTPKAARGAAGVLHRRRARAGRDRGARGGAARPRRRPSRRICRPRCAKRSSRPASTRCTDTRPPPGTCWRPATTSSSAPGRRAARASATSSPSSRPSPPTRRRAPSSSSPPRRSPRTRRASSTGFRVPGVVPAIYDGDTPQDQRPLLRRTATILLSNPDMLHVGILPSHERWAEFLHQLRYVVLDEAHVYRGVFGSHVAQVVRRLRRLCRAVRLGPALRAHLGDHRQSAGRSRSASSARRSPRWTRTRRRVPSARSCSGTRRSRTPPPGMRRSALAEASYVTAECVLAGSRVIAFAPTRKAAELVYGHVRRRLEDRRGRGAAERVQPYRAGYTPEQRRDIERRLFAHELDAVVATQALELGIDVGSLDVSLVTGFPGTITSLRQRWGRAGRSGHGYAVLVAGQDALDQYFMREPDRLLGRSVEEAIIDLHNPHISGPHLEAAAYERPLTAGRRGLLRRAGAAAGRAARPGRPAAAAQGRPGLGQAVLPRRRRRPAHREQRAVRHRRGTPGRGHRHRRARARLPLLPPRRRVPAPRAELPRAAPRPRDAHRHDRRLRRQLLHAGQDRQERADRRAGRLARAAGRGAVRRRPGGHRAGHRLPAPGHDRRPRARHDDARPARADLHHPGLLAGGAAAGARRRPGRPRRDRRARGSRLAARRRARADRPAAAVRHVRPLGHRRAQHPLALADRHAEHLRVRRLPRRHRPVAPGLRRLREPRRRRRGPSSPSAPARAAARAACRAPSAAT